MYKLSSGTIIGKGYKSTETIGVILNQRMFERKIAFLEQMIMSSDMLDKKCALVYMVDALQYYISIQDAQGVDKKYCVFLFCSQYRWFVLYYIIYFEKKQRFSKYREKEQGEGTER